MSRAAFVLWLLLVTAVGWALIYGLARLAIDAGHALERMV